WCRDLRLRRRDHQCSGTRSFDKGVHILRLPAGIHQRTAGSRAAEGHQAVYRHHDELLCAEDRLSRYGRLLLLLTARGAVVPRGRSGWLRQRPTALRSVGPVSRSGTVLPLCVALLCGACNRGTRDADARLDLIALFPFTEAAQQGALLDFGSPASEAQLA